MFSSFVVNISPVVSWNLWYKCNQAHQSDKYSANEIFFYFILSHKYLRFLKVCMMQEIQEDFYLVLFMFANQLYFYVLGPSNLLGY